MTSFRISFVSWLGKSTLHSRSVSTSAIFLEHARNKLNNASLSAIVAARKCSKSLVGVLPVGSADSPVIAEARRLGLEKLLVAAHNSYEHLLSEPVASLFAHLQMKHSFSHWWAASTSAGKNIMPRFAGVLLRDEKANVAPISDIIEVKSENSFVRPIYAGNALVEVKSTAHVNIITVRPTSFSWIASSTTTEQECTEVEAIDFSPSEGTL